MAKNIDRIVVCKNPPVLDEFEPDLSEISYLAAIKWLKGRAIWIVYGLTKIPSGLCAHNVLTKVVFPNAWIKLSVTLLANSIAITLRVRNRSASVHRQVMPGAADLLLNIFKPFKLEWKSYCNLNGLAVSVRQETLTIWGAPVDSDPFA